MYVPLAAQGWLQGVGLPIPNGIVLLPLLVRGLWVSPRTVKSNEVALIVPSIILAGQRVPRSLSGILSHCKAFAWEIVGSITVDTANYDPILVKRKCYDRLGVVLSFATALLPE